jgi:hypothetical protein
MRKLAIALVAAAFLAPAATAHTNVVSGDTCTYNGSGSAYTVNIVSGAGVQQNGFAFGANGLTISNVSISGKNGNYTTANLPTGTTAGWSSDEQLTGSLAVTLTVSGTLSGNILIIPTSSSSATTYDTVTCALRTNPAKPALDIHVKAPSYSKSAHAWRLLVNVPVAGTLSAVQPLPTNITPIKQLTAKALVQTHSIGTKTGGMLTLTLRPTSSGSIALASKSVIKVKLRVTFNAKDGRSAHKTVSLALRR